MSKIKVTANCDCIESSENNGLKIPDKARQRGLHIMSPTKVIRKNICHFCGNYVFFSRESAEVNSVQD